MSCLPAALSVADGPGGPVPLVVSPLDIVDGEYRGARLIGAWRLESPQPEFGGVSGLLVEDGSFVAVTDRGWWIEGRRGDPIAPEIVMRPMIGPDGDGFSKFEGDAEGLARLDGQLFVSFERKHRVAAEVGDGQIGEEFPITRKMPSNGGLEALATLPDGRLIAIGEGRGADHFPVILIEAGEPAVESRLPRISRHDVTGADVGPDGRLYVLQRHFSMLTGVSIRVLRYHLAQDGLPDARTAETLAAWESASGIDNMEGIAAFRDGPDGPIRLWLISDDNFNAVQRTILVELELE